MDKEGARMVAEQEEWAAGQPEVHPDEDREVGRMLCRQD